MVVSIVKKYTCTECGWTRTKETSDVIKEGDILRKCPSCDGALLSDSSTIKGKHIKKNQRKIK